MRRSLWIYCIFLAIGSVQAEENYREGEIPWVSNTDELMAGKLKMNSTGNIITARPGEKIHTLVNYCCNTEDFEPYGLYQVILGYDSLGPKECLMNELGYRAGGEGISFLWLEAPKNPGIYLVQVSLEHARSRVEALQNWSGSDSTKLTIGRVEVIGD